LEPSCETLLKPPERDGLWPLVLSGCCMIRSPRWLSAGNAVCASAAEPQAAHPQADAVAEMEERPTQFAPWFAAALVNASAVSTVVTAEMAADEGGTEVGSSSSNGCRACVRSERPGCVALPGAFTLRSSMTTGVPVRKELCCTRASPPAPTSKELCCTRASPPAPTSKELCCTCASPPAPTSKELCGTRVSPSAAACSSLTPAPPIAASAGAMVTFITPCEALLAATAAAALHNESTSRNPRRA